MLRRFRALNGAVVELEPLNFDEDVPSLMDCFTNARLARATYECCEAQACVEDELTLCRDDTEPQT